MSGPLRLALPVVLALALLTGVTYLAVSATSRRWYEDDVRLRARLAVAGARESLGSRWAQGDRAGVERLLEAIARDERILGAVACSADGAVFARTTAMPPEVQCSRLAHDARLDTPQPREWSQLVSTGAVSLHVSAEPIALADGGSAVVGLVHDMSYVDHRDALTRRAAVYAFFILALGAVIIAMLSARDSVRRFTRELRTLLQPGSAQRPEFQPILQDVRALARQLAGEAAGTGRTWTPERLRDTLREHLEGEKVVVLANREPYIHDRAPDGSVRVLHPASGLVTALEPVMRACSGTWIAHGSGSADRQVVDASDRIRVPPAEESYALRRIWLGRDEEQGYYYGFSNEGLWPLCHIAHARPRFSRDDFEHYQRVNQRFADAVCDEVDRDDPIVLVQDYHFGLAPRMIRERLPRATILTFWHIPWPNAERFGICPFREQLLEGLLGSSIVGFHVQAHCNNFLESVDRFLESRIDRERTAVVHGGHTSLVRPYPISIDWPNRQAAATPPAAECRAQVWAELGLPPDALLGVGVDRLDYTKGIEERLLAVERLLERFPRLRGRFVFAQLGAPSRTEIDRYRQLNEAVQALAARINARFGDGRYQPIVLQRQHHEPSRVFRFLRAADVLYVSSLHDGMNLVAKEFVAARDDERGVLVLSSFTGAARELTEALVVNPYDLDEAARALAAAVAMPAPEQAARMRAMRSLVSELNVYRWAGRMLEDAARLRQRDRLAGSFHPFGEAIA